MSAGIVLLPFALANPAPLTAWTPTVAAAVLALALLCSAIAYLLYFRLMKNIGPSKTLIVTLLVPLFSMLWGWLFLGEAITLTMLIGCALVLAGATAATRA